MGSAPAQHAQHEAEDVPRQVAQQCTPKVRAAQRCTCTCATCACAANASPPAQRNACAIWAAQPGAPHLRTVKWPTYIPTYDMPQCIINDCVDRYQGLPVLHRQISRAARTASTDIKGCPYCLDRYQGLPVLHRQSTGCLSYANPHIAHTAIHTYPCRDHLDCHRAVGPGAQLDQSVERHLKCGDVLERSVGEIPEDGSQHRLLPKCGGMKESGVCESTIFDCTPPQQKGRSPGGPTHTQALPPRMPCTTNLSSTLLSQTMSRLSRCI